jgi:hypothetical protein
MSPRIAPLALIGLLALAGLNAWLVVVVTADHDPKEDIRVAVSERSRLPLLAEAPPYSSRPISAYGQTLAKPVFFKSRLPYVRPPPAPQPPPKPAFAPPPAPVDPGLVLGGIMIANGVRKAYVFKKGDSRGAWLSEGDAVMGWKLEALDTMSAKLQRAGRSIELQLYPKR